MQLVIPGLVDLPRTDVGAAAVYQVNEAAALGVYPLVPLPAELDQWGREVVGGNTPDRVRVLTVAEQETEHGWPITISVSELVDPETGQATELRMHFLFRFVEYGGIAVLKATNTQAFEAAFDALKPLLGHARPDFSGAELPALALVWSGM